MEKKTAVVILNWNGRQLLEKFLPFVVENTPMETVEIIVVDNGSTDDSVDFIETRHPSILTIRFDKNYGFAGGYNRALSQLSHEYIVLLNSDVEVTRGWLTTVTDYLDSNPDVAVVQPKILSYHDKTSFEYAGASGGYLDMYGYPFCRGRIFSSVETDKGQYDTPAEVFWASGACLFIRRRDYFDGGCFDERFFSHQEEIDLCWRLRRSGRKVVCLPQSIVYHVGGGTLGMGHSHKTFLNFRNNLLMLHKNLPRRYYCRVFVYRFFSDCAAAFGFLLMGRPSNAWSVLRAIWSFYRIRGGCGFLRGAYRCEADGGDFPDGVFRGSLLSAYYLRGRRKFSCYRF
ncbi:MAG: glycosyltransferase family 2 protein [Dysgonamonadaceae bacterium]|jgi:GT2 family glycosyltransferase|nr:glycosyltransferase family 2 protein [Dysgonamonadaceae bacterium]